MKYRDRISGLFLYIIYMNILWLFIYGGNEIKEICIDRHKDGWLKLINYLIDQLISS